VVFVTSPDAGDDPEPSLPTLTVDGVRRRSRVVHGVARRARLLSFGDRRLGGRLGHDHCPDRRASAHGETRGFPGTEIRGVRPSRRYGFANVDTFGIVIAWLIVTAMIVTSAALFWISQR
jgi:hypothetical protein